MSYEPPKQVATLVWKLYVLRSFRLTPWPSLCDVPAIIASAARPFRGSPTPPDPKP